MAVSPYQRDPTSPRVACDHHSVIGWKRRKRCVLQHAKSVQVAQIAYIFQSQRWAKRPFSAIRNVTPLWFLDRGEPDNLVERYQGSTTCGQPRWIVERGTADKGGMSRACNRSQQRTSFTADGIGPSAKPRC